MKVLRFSDRDFILYECQGFYRSTGRNSRMPGAWLPCDGIQKDPLWIDKTRYCQVLPSPLYRFGTQDLKDTSAMLGGMNIRTGDDASVDEVNELLRYCPVGGKL